jgi:hypothetical protein
VDGAREELIDGIQEVTVQDGDAVAEDANSSKITCEWDIDAFRCFIVYALAHDPCRQ